MIITNLTFQMKLTELCLAFKIKINLKFKKENEK